MTEDELIEILEQDSSLNDHLTEDDYIEAIQSASQETDWVLPVTDNFQIFWIKSRSKRHCFFLLWTQSAHKFKVKQYSLNQRFDHYGEILEKMDADFKHAVEENPNKFINIEAHKLFGTIAKPGFQYNIIGQDITNYG